MFLFLLFAVVVVVVVASAAVAAACGPPPPKGLSAKPRRNSVDISCPFCAPTDRINKQNVGADSPRARA